MHKSEQKPREINWFFVSAKVTLIMTAMLVQASWTTTGCGGGANNNPLDANQQARIADLEAQLAAARNTASASPAASPSPATEPVTPTASPSPTSEPPDLIGPPVVPTVDPTETLTGDIPNVTIVDGDDDWRRRWKRRRERWENERRVMLPDPQTRGGDSFTFTRNETNINIIIINNNGTMVENLTQTLDQQKVDVEKVGTILQSFTEEGKPITQQVLQEVVDECVIIDTSPPGTVDPAAPASPASPSPGSGSQ